MGTIEYTDNNFIKKLNIANSLLEILKAYQSDHVDKICNLIENVKNDYDLISLNILHKYFTSEFLDESSKTTIIIDYHHEISKKSIPDKLNDIIHKCKQILNNNILSALDTFTYLKLIEAYNNISNYKSPIFSSNIPAIKQNIFCVSCQAKSNIFNNSQLSNNYECNEKNMSDIMAINNETSEMVCSRCGEIQEIVGTVFDDIQVYYQEGPFTKHASYERIKHGEKWLNRIQAKEKVEIKKKIINAIKKQIKHEQISDVRKVDYDLIRKCLRKTNHTKFNKHIPLIRKIITEIPPIQLTEKEIEITISYFDKVVDIFEQIKPKDKHNCPYHPYFIRKILEQHFILPENTPSEIDRKRKIISNIHTQSVSTLRKRDKVWKDICKEFKEFTYMPTDKNKYKVPI